jgi:hypothetical protein
MRIYFAADSQAEEKLQKRFARIIETLDQAGVLVMSNIENKNLRPFSDQDLERIDQSGEVLLEKMDAIIIDGTKPLNEGGYLVALSLTHQKPILYLCQKGKIINKNLFQLQKTRAASKLLKLQYYTENDLIRIILNFLPTIETKDGYEPPNIKFTLRITPRIERYLHWKTQNTELSKADFLRKLIEELIEKDEGFNKFGNK